MPVVKGKSQLLRDLTWRAGPLLRKMLDIQHCMNPLHVYCRLVERGLSKKTSISICKYYEICIYSWLVWFTAVGVNLCRLVKPTS